MTSGLALLMIAGTAAQVRPIYDRGANGLVPGSHRLLAKVSY
jgi:hypothetical protein